YSYAATAAAAQALNAGEEATDTFTYTVVDSLGASSVATLAVKVLGTNDGPVAKPLTDMVVENGGAIIIVPQFEDADAGDTADVTLDTQGTKGKVVQNEDGTFSYDPNGKFEGLRAGETATDTFFYKVTDSFGASDMQQVTITIIGQNDLAVTRTDIAGVEKNGSITVAKNNGVLSNDTDVDGDALSVAAVNGQPVGTGVAGKFGTLTMNADGSYSYVANTSPGALPAKGIAQDVFTYTVSDGLDTVTQTLTVTVYQKGQTYKGGTDGADSFVGGNGADVLNGGNGNDVLSGGNGADVLIGGTGNDFLTGGKGNDLFVFGAGSGQDQVTDFAKGDVIQLSKGQFANFAALSGAISKVGADTVIDLGGGNLVTLQNFGGTLAASDFLFL
ncbi:MAG TPA: Ig-like domain-containing protein, partial [Lautropia sp.]|nr:Ig-like domain-containing protein [Lautropia sp.]